MISRFRTTVQGRTIELPRDLALPKGRVVEVTIQTCPDVESSEEPLPSWLERFEVNPAVAAGKFVVKGTDVRVDALVALMEEGKTNEELMHTFPELGAAGLSAVQEYAKLPIEMRRSFGAWADDADELDEYLAWNRQQRKARRPEIED